MAGSVAPKIDMGRPRKGVTLNCAVCGMDFYHGNVMSNRSRKFCGLKCSIAAYRAKRVNEKDGTAKCAKCKQWKLITDFVKGSEGRPHSYCKACLRAWFEARRRRLGIRPQTPPGVAKAKAKAYKHDYNKRAFHSRRAAGIFPNKHEVGKMLCEQDARCAYCRVLLDGGFHIDHKMPVSRGGTNNLSNLHITCARCNVIKQTMTHEEFLVSKKRKVAQWSTT